MNPLRKFVSSFVTVTTVLWSMGGALLFPSIAQAATLSPSDLIKASGPAVYFYAADGNRYVFPNEKTYFSWYADFSSVVTITDAELAAIMIGGNVTIRPGTKLVKITTDPKTYAVSTRCGLLHWIESETLAEQLYGADWAQRIVDVPDAFFVDYEIGSSVSTAVHPDGQLVYYVDAPDTYYVVMNGQKRLVSASGIVDNNLDVSNAVLTDIVYGNGVGVTGSELELSALACESAAVAVTGGVTVTLASDTPAGKTVPRNSSSNALVKVNLTAGSEAARINGLRFKRVGAGAAGDFSNVYVYDENLVRLTTGRTINSTTHQVEFNSLDLDIPAGETISVYIYGDFSVLAADVGGEHAIQLADAASVMIEGTGTVAGTFPITGNVFTVGSVSAARVDINVGVTPSNPTVGSKGVEVSNFRITANTNDVEVRQVNLYQAGTISNSDLTNFELVQGTTVVATAASVNNNNLITLIFDPPFIIANGVTKVFSLRADVAGRSSRTIRTYVEYTTDVTAIDQIYDSGAAICIGTLSTEGGCSAASQGSFDGGTSSEYVEVTTQGGQLTVSFNGPSAANVAKGSLGITLYEFSMTSEESELEIRNLRFTLAGSATGNAKVKGSLGTEYFRNFKLIDTNTGITVMGPINMASTVASPATTTGETVFTDSWNLTGGTTRNLAIVADLANAEDVANEFFLTGQSAYTLTMNAFGSSDVRVADTGEFLATSDIVPNSSIAGNAQTVKAASLTVELATDPTGTTIVKKQQGVASVGVTLSAGQQSDVTITSLKITGMAQTAMASGYTVDKFDQLIIKLSLWDGATQLGTAEVPSSGEATITNFQLLVGKGTTKNLTVKADVASTVSSATGTDDFTIGVAAANDVTSQDEDANAVTATVSVGLVANAAATGQTVVMSVRNAGVITYQQNNHPSNSILVGGGDVWKVFARYKATAQYEAVTIDRLRVIHPNDDGTNADFTLVAVASAGDTTNREAILSAGTTSTKDIDLSQNPLVVPKDGSIEFELWAKLAAPVATSSATSYSPRSGDTPSLGVATHTQTGEWSTSYINQLNIRATGDASGERLYASSTSALVLVGNTQVIRKGKPVVTKLAPSSAVLTPSSLDLYKFQINADADGSGISWMQIMFSVTTSTNITSLSAFKFLKGATELTANTEVFIRDWDGIDLTGSTSLNSDGVSGNLGNIVVVRLVSEENVAVGGTTYTLRATPALSGTSVATLSTSFYRPSGSVVTGYLADDGGPNKFGHALGINAYASGTQPALGTNYSSATGTFLWSDNVDVPHSYASGTIGGMSGGGGSSDWTNDIYVESMNDTQTLTRG